MNIGKAVAHTPEYNMFWNVLASGSAGTVRTQEREQQKFRIIKTLSKGVQCSFLHVH